jgi:hypothetical protein
LVEHPLSMQMDAHLSKRLTPNGVNMSSARENKLNTDLQCYCRSHASLAQLVRATDFYK